MIKQSKKNSKIVTVIARVQFKCDARKVVYLVRSSDGQQQYEVCLFDGKATSCNCASRKPCKHMIRCAQAEAERTAKSADKSYQQAIDEKLDGCYDSDPRIETEESLSDPWDGLDADERATAYGYYLMSIGA